MANQVTVVDISRKAVFAEIATGSYLHGLRLSSDGRELNVANVTDNSVSVIDTKNLKESARIPVGKALVQVAFTPNGAQVYVSLRDENSVAVIDIGTQRVVDTVTTGMGAHGVVTSDDGKWVFIMNRPASDAPGSVRLRASFQGCNDPTGVCYPPMDQTLSNSLTDSAALAAPIQPAVEQQSIDESGVASSQAARKPVSDTGLVRVVQGNGAIYVHRFES